MNNMMMNLHMIHHLKIETKQGKKNFMDWIVSTLNI